MSISISKRNTAQGYENGFKDLNEPLMSEDYYNPFSGTEKEGAGEGENGE